MAASIRTESIGSESSGRRRGTRSVGGAARWTCTAEARTSGAFHAVHPRGTASVADVVEAARACAGADTRFVWADPAWLAEVLGDDVGQVFPMWDPEPGSSFMDVDSARAAAAGLPTRPLAETVRDVLTWDTSRGPDVPRPHGLSPERERELLASMGAQSA